MTLTAFIVVRSLHLGSCLLIFGWWFFDQFVAGPIKNEPGTSLSYRTMLRWSLLGLWPVALLSGGAWFVLVAMEMSGQGPGEVLRGETLRTVLQQTRFGQVWPIHLLGGVVGGLTTLRLLVRANSLGTHRSWEWLNLVAYGLFLASLAWAGHGLVGSPVVASWHLAADAFHLLIAGIWPGGLLPLALVLALHRQDSSSLPGRAEMVQRFSRISLISVGGLALTGFFNSWVMVRSWHNLLGTPYGQWLCLKILLFAGAIACGAQNLLRLKPRLSEEGLSERNLAADALERNVRCELVFTTAIIVVVAVLGMTAPCLNPIPIK
jgi:putative copper resistance protein D